jgi:hypothetical protein
VSRNDAVLFRVKCGGAAKTQDVSDAKAEFRWSLQVLSKCRSGRLSKGCVSNFKENRQQFGSRFGDEFS